MNFLRENGYASDGLDKRLTAIRRYEMLARGRNETLQAFYLRENMLITDMVKSSCAPSESSRAHNMLTKSGLTNDQITTVYSHVTSTSPADAQELTPAKVQATVLKFYDKPWDPFKRDQSASKFLYSRPIIGEGPTSSRTPAHTNHVTEGSGENNDDDKIDGPEDWYYQEVLALSEAWNNGEFGAAYEYPDDDDADIETYFNGGEWLHCDAWDVEVLDNILEEECMNDDMVAEAYVPVLSQGQTRPQPGPTWTWFLARRRHPHRRGSPASIRSPSERQGQGQGPRTGSRKRGIIVYSLSLWRQEGPLRREPSQAQARAHATTTAPSSSSSGSLKSRLASRTSCRRCGKIGHWEADCPQQPDSAKRPRTDFPRPPAAQHFAWTSYMVQDVPNIEKWVESAEDKALEHAALMTVTSTMPEGHVIIDCGAAMDCVGECALAKNAQYVLARGDVCEATTRTCRQDLKFGGPDQGAVTATYAVSLPCTPAGVKTQLSAYAVPGSTPHLVSRRWLSHHKAVISMDPEALFLTSPSFPRPIPLTLHGSGHIMMSLIDSDPGPTTTYFSIQAIRHPEIYVIADDYDDEAPALEYIQEGPQPPRPPLRLRIRSDLGEVSSYVDVPETAPQLPDDRHERPRLHIGSDNRASTPTPASSTRRTRTSSTTTSSATSATISPPPSATTPPVATTHRRPSSSVIDGPVVVSTRGWTTSSCGLAGLTA